MGSSMSQHESRIHKGTQDLFDGVISSTSLTERKARRGVNYSLGVCAHYGSLMTKAFYIAQLYSPMSIGLSSLGAVVVAGFAVSKAGASTAIGSDVSGAGAAFVTSAGGLTGAAAGELRESIS